jgi:hypothetical protein
MSTISMLLSLAVRGRRSTVSVPHRLAPSATQNTPRIKLE